MFDFRPSAKLAKALSRQSDLIRQMSRDVDNNLPGFLFVSGRFDVEKAREMIGQLLGSTFVGLGAVAGMRGRFHSLALIHNGCFVLSVQEDLVQDLQLKDSRKTRRLLLKLCQELIDWLGQKPGQRLDMDRRCPVQSFVLASGNTIRMKPRRHIPLDDWAKDPPTAKSVPIEDLDDKP